jgi:phage/plasmid-like protein (TIGR03299 family)
MTHATTNPAHAPLDPQRLSAWARLGTPVSTARTAREALAAAGLAGWNIRKVEMTAHELGAAGVTRIDNPEQVMLVRDDPATGATRYLSTVGHSYGVHQNEASADLIDTLVAETGARGIGHAGHLDGGRKVFVTIQLPQPLLVEGVDAHELHLVVFNSHDGSSAFRVALVPYRVVCANQASMAIRSNAGCVSIRHTSRSTIDINEIRASLGRLSDYRDAFAREARRLINTAMTRVEYLDLINTMWPVKVDAPARARSNAHRRTGELLRLWTSAPTQAQIRDTRWAAYQSITEYLDHHTPAKDPGVRALRVLAGTDVAARKQRAYDLLTV